MKYGMMLMVGGLACVMRTWPGTPFSPVAFHGFTVRKADLASASVTVGMGASETGGATGVVTGSEAKIRHMPLEL